MLHRCFLALALFTSLLSAQLLQTEADATAAEARLQANPTDVQTRMRLLFYYDSSGPNAMPADRVRPLRRKHILWMIENQPDHTTLSGIPGDVLEKSGSPLADPDGWAEADLAWKRVVAQPVAPPVWANAIAFYRVSDPALALDLAERGLTAHPHNERIGTAKGAVLAYMILGVHHLDRYGRATSFDDAFAASKEALAARKQVESTSEAAVAAGAAEVLGRQLTQLSMQRRAKDGEDLVALSERLDQRAMELEPQNPKWKRQLASLYWTQSSSKRTPAEKIELLQKSVALADDSLQLYVMPDLAKAYFGAGNHAKATETAKSVLEIAKKDEGKPAVSNGNYGSAVHDANIVLGRIALKENNVQEAKSRLLAAGRVPGTPVLMSFGPDWNLARDLLGKGEQETVLSYIELCRAFWSSGTSRLASWAATLRAGGSPNFFAPPEVNRTQLVSKAAPEFRLKKLGGGEISLADLKGKVVLLDFWATWCAPCRAEMPEFEKLHKELSTKDVAILAVDADESEDTVADFIKKEKYTMPVLLTEGTDTVKRYGISAYPTTLAVDKEGRVAEVVIGNSADAGKRLRAAIDKARSGAPATPPPDVIGGVIGSIPSAAPPPPPPPAANVPAAVTADDFYRDGYRLRAARDLQGAVSAFDRALALHKDWLPAIVDRADSLYQLKRYDQAIEGMTDAIRLDPKRAASYHERGLAYAGAGRHAEAIADYSRALELAPNADNYSHRAFSHLELGHTSDALADANHALDLSPALEPALNTRSRVSLAQKQYVRVVEDCEAALRVNPKSSWAAARKDEALRLMGGRPGSLPAPKLLSPAPGAVFDHYPRQTTLVWAEVAGAASYRIEWDYRSGNSWSDHPGSFTAKEPVFTFSFVGAQPGRWRVWAIDSEGREGAKSEWREFEYKR